MYKRQIQDEAHRFAIEYHRSLRGKGQVKSILDDIPGIGPARRKALMRHFKEMCIRDRVKMTIQKTVENSDIHGILVSWEHEGVFYELWEDDARDSMDAVIEMASAIAVRSAAVQGN